MTLLALPTTEPVEMCMRTPGVVELQLHGTIGAAEVRQLRAQLDPLLLSRPSRLTAVLVDFSGVHQCDCRALPGLHEIQRRVRAVGGRFVVRGLAPAALAGFPKAGLGEMTSIHQASLALAPPRRQPPSGPDVVMGRVSTADLKLAQVCRELASADQESSEAVAQRLVGRCRDLLGLSAAVVLTAPVGADGELMIVAGAENARVAAGAGLFAEQGPVVECIHLAEPVHSPDTAQDGRTWPRYVDAVLRHDVRAVWALPLRLPLAPGSRRPPTCLGALVLVSALPVPLAPADVGLAQVMAEFAAVAIDTIAAATAPVSDVRDARSVG